MTMPVFVHAEETVASAPVEAEFDSAFLIGDAQKVDISRFKYGNPVLPGEYNVDVYVNGQWFGKRRMFFKALESNKNAVTCFTGNTLAEYGVKQEILAQHAPLQKENSSCYKIEEWVENAFYEFDNSRLRVDISIPQVALQKMRKAMSTQVYGIVGLMLLFYLITAVLTKHLLSLMIKVKQQTHLWA